MKKLLGAAYALILENIDADQLEAAEKTLTSVDIFEELDRDLFQEEYEHWLLLRGKLKIQEGRNGCRRGPANSEACEGSIHFEEAVEELDKISAISQSDRYLLALSRKAYACYLLVKCTGVSRWAEELQQTANKVWQVMWEYLTTSKEEPPQFEAFYHQATLSTKYKRLLITNKEYSRYLNLDSALKTQTTFYLFEVHSKFQTTSSTLQSIDLINKHLKDWKEIYFTILKYEQFQLNSVPLILQRYLSSAHHALATRYYNSGVWCEYKYHWLKAIEYQLLRYNTIKSYFGDFSPRLSFTIEFIRNYLEEIMFKSKYECENRTSLEIEGVPETVGENCSETVKKIAEDMGVDLQIRDICYAERMERKYHNQLYGSMTVKFTDYSICKRLRTANRRKKLSDKTLAPFDTSKIYIHALFTREKHALYREAKACFYSAHLDCTVYIDDEEGRIVVRKRCRNPEEKSTKYYVNHKNDLYRILDFFKLARS